MDNIKSKQKFFEDKISKISKEKKSMISSLSNPGFIDEKQKNKLSVPEFKVIEKTI